MDKTQEDFKEASAAAYLSPEVVIDESTSSAYIEGYLAGKVSLTSQLEEATRERQAVVGLLREQRDEAWKERDGLKEQWDDENKLKHDAWKRNEDQIKEMQILHDFIDQAREELAEMTLRRDAAWKDLVLSQKEAADYREALIKIEANNLSSNPAPMEITRIVLTPEEFKLMLQEYAALWESQLQTATFYLKSKGITVSTQTHKP